MKIHLTTFFTHNKYGQPDYYVDSVRNLIESSKKIGINHFHIYTPDNLPIAAHLKNWMENDSDMYGFYSFKPYLILETLKKLPLNDVLIYHDAGRKEYNYSFKKDLTPLINDVISNSKGIGIGIGHWPHKELCKRDCFVQMGCDNEKYWDLSQATANWSIWQKNNLSLEFLEEWVKWSFSPKGIITNDDSISHYPEFPEYKYHRWDQSILTNLAYKYYFENRGVNPMKIKEGWEKDINLYVEGNYENPFAPTLYKTPNTLITPDKITTVIDAFYKDGQLKVLTSGAVKDVQVVTDDGTTLPTGKIIDPHRNVYLFSFHLEYKETINLKLINFNNRFKDHNLTLKIEKDYYKSYKDEHLVTAICNGFHNSLESIHTFVTYHINLGVDRIILHYREGSNLDEICRLLKDYIEKEKVIIINWDGKVPFYQDIRNDGDTVGLGEVAHMNHVLNVFKESKYITWLNIDQLLVVPQTVTDLTLHIDNLRSKYSAIDKGGFIIKLFDFKNNEGELKYYKSIEQINNISPFPQLTYFTQNVEAITSHNITLGKEPANIPTEELVVNHYPFLDNNRKFNDKVIGQIDNLNKNLFL